MLMPEDQEEERTVLVEDLAEGQHRLGVSSSRLVGSDECLRRTCTSYVKAMSH